MNSSREEFDKLTEQLAAREAILAAREADSKFFPNLLSLAMLSPPAFAAQVERELEVRITAARQEWEAAAELKRCEARGRQEGEPELQHPTSRKESFAIESSKFGSYY